MDPRRVFLAALLVPFFTLSGQVQQQGGAGGEPSAATIAAKAKKAKLDPKHAKNAGRPGNIYGWVSAQ